MTWLELVRVYFPWMSDEEANYLLWECTAFPVAGLDYVVAQLEQHATRGEITRGWC